MLDAVGVEETDAIRLRPPGAIAHVGIRRVEVVEGSLCIGHLPVEQQHCVVVAEEARLCADPVGGGLLLDDRVALTSGMQSQGVDRPDASAEDDDQTDGYEPKTGDAVSE